MTPDDVEAIAALAYAEMLESGFTRVGEFHYLHHDLDGRPTPTRRDGRRHRRGRGDRHRAYPAAGLLCAFRLAAPRPARASAVS